MGRTPRGPRLVTRRGNFYVAYWDYAKGCRRYKSCEEYGAITAEQRKKMLGQFWTVQASSAATALNPIPAAAYDSNMRQAVQDFLDAQDKRVLVGQLKPKSFRRLQNVLLNFKAWLPSGLTTGALDHHRIESYIMDIAGEGYAPDGVNVFRQNVRTCLRWLAKVRPRLFQEPELFWDAVKIRKTPRPLPLAYTPGQLRKYRKHVKPAYRLLFLLLACTGARFNEVRTLRWTNVDLKRGRITFTGKRGRVRVLPLVSEIAGLPDVAPGLLKALRGMKRGEYVCAPWHTGDWKWLRRAAKNSGVRINAQGLRKNFVSYAAAVGVPAAVCAMWVGHSAIVAEEHYRGQVLEARRGKSIQAAMGL